VRRQRRFLRTAEIFAALDKVASAETISASSATLPFATRVIATPREAFAEQLGVILELRGGGILGIAGGGHSFSKGRCGSGQEHGSFHVKSA